MNVSRRDLRVALLPLLALFGSASAQVQPANDAERPARRMESLLVIGRQIEAGREDLAGSLDIIGRDELDYMHVRDTMELFNKAPGVYIARYNQGIINTDIAIRGFAGDGSTPHAKLLIDGIPSNLHSGAPELDQLFPLGIASIELFKGTSDPRYGIYNIAGSYNVTSRSDVGNNEIEATVGSYGIRELQGYIGVEQGRLTHNYAFGYREGHGYRDHTDLRKYALSGRWFYALGDNSSVGLIARTSGYEGDAPGYLDKLTARRDPTSAASYANQDGGEKSVDHLSLHADTRPSDAVLVTTKLYWQAFERERWVRFSESASIQNRYDDQEHIGALATLAWQIDPHWQLTAGADTERQEVIEQRFGTIGQSRQRNTGAVLRNFRYDFETTGSYVQLEHAPNDLLRWNIGYRVDRLSGDFTQISAAGLHSYRKMYDFGWIEQPKLNLFVNATEHVTLFANYGRSFQHPFGSSAYTAGDRRARDVSLNDGWETGLSWRATDGLETRLSIWEQIASDEVVSVDGTPRNVGETERRGLDVGFTWRVTDHLELWGNYSHTDTEIVRAGSADVAYIGNELRSIPDYTASLGAAYLILPQLTARVHIDAQGDYYINEANLGGRYGGYTLVGAVLVYEQPWGDISLQGNNLFDRYYEYVYDFGQTGAESVHSPGDGRNVSLSVSWKL
jgi:iron complex outermembrane receptor protein